MIPRLQLLLRRNNADRLLTEVWDYLNEQIGIWNALKDKIGAESDSHEEWSKTSMDAFLRGGKYIESLSVGLRKPLWIYFAKSLALPNL
jgi:hypothetical protein